MRSVTPSGTLVAMLALALGFAPGLSARAMAQGKGPGPAPVKAPAQSKAPVQGKVPAKRKAAPAGKAKAPVEAMAALPAAAPASRRDPFEPLVSRQRPGAGLPEHLPPGKAGLVIATLRVDGVVRAPSGMIAVVANPQQRVYFLREGDRVFDGQVEKISMEGVSFHEVGKDPFGKPIERQVTKRLYPSAGEQQ